MKEPQIAKLDTHIEFVNATAVYPADQGNISNAKKRWYISEPFIQGQFVKWFNNGAFVNKSRSQLELDLMSAFAHFTYHKSKKTLILMDLQGNVKNEKDKTNYILSDPAFQSSLPAGGVFGPCDMGAHAINAFFNHTHPRCNEFCNEYMRPSHLLPSKGGTLSNGSNTLSRNHMFVSNATFKSVDKCYPQMEQTLRNVTIINKEWGAHMFKQWSESRKEALKSEKGTAGNQENQEQTKQKIEASERSSRFSYSMRGGNDKAPVGSVKTNSVKNSERSERSGGSRSRSKSRSRRSNTMSDKSMVSNGAGAMSIGSAGRSEKGSENGSYHAGRRNTLKS